MEDQDVENEQYIQKEEWILKKMEKYFKGIRNLCFSTLIYLAIFIVIQIYHQIEIQSNFELYKIISALSAFVLQVIELKFLKIKGLMKLCLISFVTVIIALILLILCINSEQISSLSYTQMLLKLGVPFSLLYTTLIQFAFIFSVKSRYQKKFKTSSYFFTYDSGFNEATVLIQKRCQKIWKSFKQLSLLKLFITIMLCFLQIILITESQQIIEWIFLFVLNVSIIADICCLFWLKSISINKILTLQILTFLIAITIICFSIYEYYTISDEDLQFLTIISITFGGYFFASYFIILVYLLILKKEFDRLKENPSFIDPFQIDRTGSENLQIR